MLSLRHHVVCMDCSSPYTKFHKLAFASSFTDLGSSVCIYTGGKGLYAAIDAVGGETTKQVALALRDGGTVYVYGALSGDPVQVDTLDMLYKYKKVEVRSS